MTRAFFSYAHEDKAAVDLVYNVFLERYPQHQAWLDKYEIVGGQDLLDRIAEGMDTADRFVIFLSRAAVKKPWVNRELKRAVMRELTNLEPSYVVPVRLDDLDAMPAFLEHKFFVDLSRLTKDEWLIALNAALTGEPVHPSGADASDNIRVRVDVDRRAPHVVTLWFEAVAWAEPFSFSVVTSSDFVRAQVTEVPRGGIAGNAFRDMLEWDGGPRYYGARIGDPLIRPGAPLGIQLTFPHGTDAARSIEGVARVA